MLLLPEFAHTVNFEEIKEYAHGVGIYLFLIEIKIQFLKLKKK